MHFISHQSLGDITEREFLVDTIPGTLWTPASASADSPAPLILMGHPGNLGRMRPRLVARAQRAAADGFATASIELPGSGDRPRLPEVEHARNDLQLALAAGEPVDEIVDRLVMPLVERAVPEWITTLDKLLALPDLRGPVGFSGGILAIALRLTLVEPRIAAAGFFAGSFVPRAMFAEAKQLRTPAHVLLQWDDAGNDRQLALDFFDALGSSEKTLQANLGGHAGVPDFAGDDAARFFQRHLG